MNLAAPFGNLLLGQVFVSSDKECPPVFYSKNFLLSFGKSIGLTSVVADQGHPYPEEIVVEPVGSGYIANKNRIIGGVRSLTMSFVILAVETNIYIHVANPTKGLVDQDRFAIPRLWRFTDLHSL